MMEISSKSEIVRKRRKSGLIVWDAGVGENKYPCSRTFMDLIQKHAHKKNDTLLDGIDGLAEQVKTMYYPRPFRILFGNGMKELLFVAQMAFRGTIVHITPSCNYYYKQLACLRKVSTLVEIHTSYVTGWKVSPEEIDHVFESISGPKMLLFNNPNNPTSVVYSVSEVESLAVICHRHDVVVLADEMYSKLAEPFVSMASYLPCIRGSSISKDLAAGRCPLGWLAFPHKYKLFAERCFSFASTLCSSASPSVQYALRDFLSLQNAYDRYCSEMRQVYFEKTGRICSRLRESTRLLFVPTQAAWYLFLNFYAYKTELRNIGVESSEKLCSVMLDEIGLVCVHGDAFRTPSPLCVRLSLVDFEEMDNGVTRLIVWLRKLE